MVIGVEDKVRYNHYNDQEVVWDAKSRWNPFGFASGFGLSPKHSI